MIKIPIVSKGTNMRYEVICDLTQSNFGYIKPMFGNQLQQEIKWAFKIAQGNSKARDFAAFAGFDHSVKVPVLTYPVGDVPKLSSPLLLPDQPPSGPMPLEQCDHDRPPNHALPVGLGGLVPGQKAHLAKGKQ
jgi:hypothetical protein